MTHDNHFQLSDTDYCPKCGKWNPMPVPMYESGLFGERMRVSCICGYSVTHPCLDDLTSLTARLDRLIERLNAFKREPT